MRIQLPGLPLTILIVTAFEVLPGASTVDQRPFGDGLSGAPHVLPSNLEADPVFRPFLDRMLESSVTFRQQCRRLAVATGLRVRVLVEDQPRPSSSFNARTALVQRGGSLVLADVYLRISSEIIEHIAHELEHILEALDGVDLQARIGSGLVWKTVDDAFETRRAIERGRQVAREVTMGSAVNDVRTAAPASQIVRLTTIVQQGRDGSPSSSPSARTSGNGRYVVFISSARLVESDRNDFQDVYVLDFASGDVTLESSGVGATPSNGLSSHPDISRDGRYVVFESAAGNLLDAAFPPGTSHVFLRDRQQNVTGLLTSSAQGRPANGPSRDPVISADGGTVVFESTATDLIDAGSEPHTAAGIYFIRVPSGVKARVDVSSATPFGLGQSFSPSVSADGRFVVFMSKADLTCTVRPMCAGDPRDRNGIADIYLRDTHTNTTNRITRSHNGGDTDGASYHPAISGDGRYVAFVSEASNLTREATGGVALVYVVDRASGVIEVVSRAPSGRPGNGPSGRPALSYDGSRVAFQSTAGNLLCERKCHAGESDVNLLWDVFIHDRSTHRTMRASSDAGEEWMENSRGPSLDDAGCVLTFGSRHPVNERDVAYDEDLFVVSACRGPEGSFAATEVSLRSSR